MAQKWVREKQKNKMKNATDIKIFIVDDDPFCRNLYEQCLISLGYSNVQQFDNGQDCINELIEQPDIVFLDYCMEPLNGLEVLKKIKRFNPNIFLVVVSGQDDMEVAVNALKYGAFDYIVKGSNELDRINIVMQKINNVTGMLAKKSTKKISKLLSFRFI